ncbi:hypothetical protein BC831DRAFT_429061 [Entophlyctis helioformis]|nr:hypothetical protein BC831DRAFT_429061 [Entophlyctis helioformis]
MEGGNNSNSSSGQQPKPPLSIPTAHGTNSTTTNSTTTNSTTTQHHHGTQPPPPPHAHFDRPKRIIIIGGGVAGLTLALALKRLSAAHGLNFQPVVYEATTTYTDRGPHYLLWRWAVEALLELGLGRRLGSVAWPVVKFSSVDCASGEELVRWPPAYGPGAASSPTLSAPGTPLSATAPAFPPAAATASAVRTPRSAGTAGTAGMPDLDYPSKAATAASGSPHNAQPASTAINADPHAYLPPLLGLRKPDLIRLLMTALAGRDDLVNSPELAVKGANNNDFEFYSQAKRAHSAATASNGGLDASGSPIHGGLPPPPGSYDGPGIPFGLDGDLAHGNWFENEGFSHMLPEIHMGYELDSYIISASTGTVRVRFTNGATDRGFMLVGADGVHSKVRGLLLNERVPAQHAMSTIFTGISRVYMPPPDAPLEFDTGKPIPQKSRDEIFRFCPDGSAKSYVDRGISFGVSNIGNGFLGWNLIVAQTEPGQVTNSYVLARRRREVGAAIAAMSIKSTTGTSMIAIDSKLGSLPLHSPVTTQAPQLRNPQSPAGGPPGQPPLQHAVYGHKLITSSSADDWLVPASARSSTVDVTGRGSTADISQPIVVASSFSGTGGQHGSDADQTTVNVALSPASNAASPEAPGAADSAGRVTTLPAFEDPTFLNGEESRHVALSYINRMTAFPPEAAVIIARTDANFTASFDNYDLGEVQPDSYTSPNYHPGRVVLIGDAAHAVATAAHGSLGASLAIADAIVLAKLLGHYFNKDTAVAGSPGDGTAGGSSGSMPLTPAPMTPTASVTSGLLNATLSRLPSLNIPAAAVAASDSAGSAPISAGGLGSADGMESGRPSMVSTADGSEIDADARRLKAVAQKYVELRVGPCNAIVRDARSEVAWVRQEQGLWKNLVRMSVGYTWSRSSYQTMLTRGAPTRGSDESISWPLLSPPS